jgi:hypothetical protein
MVKKPGVPLLKNRIKRKSAQLKKAGLTSPVKLREEKRFFLWDEDSPEEGLEDTPVVCVQPEQPLLCKAAAPAQTEPPVEPEKPAKRAHITHRRQNAVIGALHSAADAATRLFSPARKKSRGNAAALEFAESHKRLGRRGRRKRKILVYGGSAIAVVAAVLLVLLVPGGAAAPSGAQSTATQVADVTASAAVSGSAAVNTTATVTANATTAYSAPATPSKAPTPTPIPTTAPDPTEIPIDMDELLEYYAVDADLYYNEVGYSNNHYEYTQDELHILAQLIWGKHAGRRWKGRSRWPT